MKISELYRQKRPVVSFEIFPPKMDTPIESIYDTLEQFKALRPDFISVTYGAGGSHKDRTVEISSKIRNEYGIEAMSHFTCVGLSKEDIDSMLVSLNANGLENILALRGDPPMNDPNFDFGRNVFRYANELISYIRGKDMSFCIAAAAYVEGHAESKRIKDDMLRLKDKVDTGVDLLVTQLFFDNRLFYEFMERANALDIKCPVTPGIMPIFRADQIKRITSLCGASIPAKLVVMMDKYESNPEDLRKAGIDYASQQIIDLVSNGVDGIHLLTMNRPKSSKEILEKSGLILP